MLDFSEEMLTVARERFKDNPNVDFAIGDYREVLPEGRFDIVISGLSIHHLSFEEKQELAIRVYNILTPEGEFVNSDLARCENELHEREMHRRLDDFIRENLGEEMLQKFKISQDLDIPVTIAEQFEFLRNAGFRIIDCLYRYWIYGVFYGRK
jgi:tRNA (cmo5U34)-methyltransferase